MLHCAGTSPPSGVTASQNGPTSITVTWTPSSDATDYIIYYSTTGGGSSGSQTVSGGDTMTHTLTDLTNGETYTISIVATIHFPSNNVSAQTNVPLGKVYTVFTRSILIKEFPHAVPGEPVIGEPPTATATSISLSWSVPDGSVVTSYEIAWSSEECSDSPVDNMATIAGSSTNITLSDLRPSTVYTVTMTACNSGGNSTSQTVTVNTMEAG